MGVAPTKIIMVILSSEVALVSSHQYYCYQKSKQTSIKKICSFTINRDHSYKK